MAAFVADVMAPSTRLAAALALSAAVLAAETGGGGSSADVEKVKEDNATLAGVLAELTDGYIVIDDTAFTPQSRFEAFEDGALLAALLALDAALLAALAALLALLAALLALEAALFAALAAALYRVYAAKPL